MREPILSECLELLANVRRRQVVAKLQTEGETTVEDLASELSGDVYEDSPEQIHAALHHNHLPKLQSYGIVEYDPDSGSVTYRSHDGVERLLESLPSEEAASPVWSGRQERQ